MYDPLRNGRSDRQGMSPSEYPQRKEKQPLKAMETATDLDSTDEEGL